jgi:hypothetical protein
MTKKHHKPRKPKKHIAYRISTSMLASLFLLVFTAVFYFLILISIEYKSFPAITKEIEKRVNNELVDGSRIEIGKSYLKFSTLHKIKIKFDDIKLIADDKKDFILPRIEAEFSIFNLILSRIIPSKLKIISPEVEIDNTSSAPKIAINGIGGEAILQENLKVLSQIFLSLKDGDVPIKNFLILDAKINIHNKNSTQKIIIRRSQIRTSFVDGYLNFNSQSTINFNPLLPDLLISPTCKFKKLEGLKCDIYFKNFLPATIPDLHPKLAPFKKITGGANGNIKLEIDGEKHLSKLSFNAKSESGNFNYPQFFGGKVDFQNLSIDGNLDNTLKTFTISNLTSNFGNAKFAMTLSATNFMDKDQQKIAMEFKINNTPTNNLDILWPVFLNGDGVRDWFMEHIKDGIIKDGYATMSLQYKNGIGHLEKINSELIFSGLNLKYSEHFPLISNIDGVAAFSKHQMKIDIAKANVLQSTINFATVAIPDFRIPILNISGKVSGAAADSLKHINYKSEFANQIENYFNGDAQTNVEIKLPIIQHLKLQDTYIKVWSNIQNFNNDYIASDSNLIINTTKEVGSNDFVTNVDLTNADIDLGQFSIVKIKGAESKINTVIHLDQANHLQLNKFDWKQENKTLNGNLLLSLDPLNVEEVKFNNNNFANSNFSLDYKVSSNSRLIKLKGKTLDLKNFFKQDSGSNSDSKNLGLDQKNNIEIDLDEVYLANKWKLTDVNVDIDCQFSACKNGFIRAHLEGNKNLNILILSPKSAKHGTKIEGIIDDISIVSKAFNLSSQINGGKTKIKAEMLKDGELQGELKINSGFTILKNEVVEKIYNDNIFSDLKNKIVNENEIEFNDLKLDFVLKNNGVDINKLIASSYLLGFTAKGGINFSENEITLKGLIIPGYSFNKLFGIGQVPVLGKIIVGEEGGGLFAVRYDYTQKDGKSNFKINPSSAIVPGGIRNVFDLF